MTPTPLYSLTIREMIDALEVAAEVHGDDTQVLIASDYGDIGHTQQVSTITSDLDGDLVTLEESGYSQSGWAVRQEEEEEESEEDAESDEDDRKTRYLVIF